MSLLTSTLSCLREIRDFGEFHRREREVNRIAYFFEFFSFFVQLLDFLLVSLELFELVLGPLFLLLLFDEGWRWYVFLEFVLATYLQNARHHLHQASLAPIVHSLAFNAAILFRKLLVEYAFLLRCQILFDFDLLETPKIWN
jgi:hypothetical protein